MLSAMPDLSGYGAAPKILQHHQNKFKKRTSRTLFTKNICKNTFQPKIGRKKRGSPPPPQGPKNSNIEVEMLRTSKRSCNVRLQLKKNLLREFLGNF